MKPAISLLLAVLVWVTAMPKPLDADAARVRMQSSRPEAGGPETDREQTASREEPAQAIARVIGQMKMNLEGSSIRGFLLNIHAAKFEDYPRFEEMIERLLREDVLRVYFRQVSNSIQQDIFRTILDAELEITRKDSAGRLERRRGRITIRLERTSEGWKIINITPRDFFAPYNSDGRPSQRIVSSPRGETRYNKKYIGQDLANANQGAFFWDAERYRRADGGSHGPGRGRQHRPTL